MEIVACARCASVERRAPSAQDGTLWGVTGGRMVCRDCEYRGTPLQFEDPADYEAFKAAVERGENPAGV